MEAAIYIAMLTGILLGFAFAHIEYRRKIVKLNTAHKRVIKDTDRAAFIDGWNQALESREAVRAAYNKLHIVIR